MDTTQPLDPMDALLGRLIQIEQTTNQLLVLVTQGFERMESELKAVRKDVSRIDHKLDAFIEETLYLKRRVEALEAKPDAPPLH
jgi:septal ring factor EnvC (AmiA/AmiB activator)